MVHGFFFHLGVTICHFSLQNEANATNSLLTKVVCTTLQQLKGACRHLLMHYRIHLEASASLPEPVCIAYTLHLAWLLTNM